MLHAFESTCVSTCRHQSRQEHEAAALGADAHGAGVLEGAEPPGFNRPAGSMLPSKSFAVCSLYCVVCFLELQQCQVLGLRFTYGG